MIKFVSATNCPDYFFSILPKDWRNDIAPLWNDYKNTSSIYILKENNNILGGGIIFSKVSPDLEWCKLEAQKWFDKGFLYLAFIWIDEKHRNKKLGSKWLAEVQKKYLNQKFWLTIEDINLKSFYKKNGFKLVKSIINENQEEWILTN